MHNNHNLENLKIIKERQSCFEYCQQKWYNHLNYIIPTSYLQPIKDTKYGQ